MTLIQHAYGKSNVRLLKVTRGPERHQVDEVTVQIRFEGDYADAYVLGSNSAVLPTDTMKNTVYALAKEHAIVPLEAFALHLARHFVAGNPELDLARVEVSATPWQRLETAAGPHAAAFVQQGPGRDMAVATASRAGVAVDGGIDELTILKTRGSAFTNFKRDRFTTLRDKRDRLLGTNLIARWRYRETGADFVASRAAVRAALLATFADHQSESVQHTLYAMAEAALAAAPALARIQLVMPNKHNLEVDLSPFGLENKEEILLPIDEPSGHIEATVERS